MFRHDNDHTAGNDAARTMMSAIWMVLPPNRKQGTNPTMQQVADHIERGSQTSSLNPYGTVECCVRCGGRDHSVGLCTVQVTCAACDRFDQSPNRADNIHSHIETHCDHVAWFNAWLRRVRDAFNKRRPNRDISPTLRKGPVDAGSHPYSTWPTTNWLSWPLRPEELRYGELNDDQLNEVLASGAMSIAHRAEVQNLAPALYNFPVPEDPEVWWVQTPSTSPTLNPPATEDSGRRSSTTVVTMSEQRARLRAAAEPSRPTSSQFGFQQ